MYPDITEFFINHTAVWEKGKVNHPKDPGGYTNDGVAETFITDFANTKDGAEFLRSLGIVPNFVWGYLNKQAKEKSRIFDPELLMSFTPTQCRKILIYRFWDKTKLNQAACVLAAYATFDFCVNSGAHRGCKYLQASANDYAEGKIILAEDGILGPKSFVRLNDFSDTEQDLLLALRVCKRRESFLRSLSTFSTFGRGWINRVDSLREYLRRMAQHA